MKVAGAVGAAFAALAIARVTAAAPTLVALTESGALLVFATDHPEAATQVSVRGVAGTLIGIDLRPADQRIYGLSTTNEIYTIDPKSGDAKLISSLTVPFDGGAQSGIDFNPQADRLRLVSAQGQNLRVNVELGATAVDRSVAYARGDPNAGKRPGITASAYTHSVPGAATTKLYNLDTAQGVLTVQDPPNDGVQVTVGPLGVHLGPLAGFEIVTDSSGEERAYAASGATLYAVDLSSGAATALGTIGAGDASVVSLTAAGDR
ncbi:MAG TPA: DUF4394 domain-containing protein [Myxococcota bacterium]|nr:DUF4394 domain-containing protein [Myxococcota bacterium]